MRTFFRILFALSVAGLLLASCTKQPGEGGQAIIRGRVMNEVRLVLSNPSTAVASYPAADENVFIIYGDNTSPDDDVETNFDGEFAFRFLRPGTYTIYVYSADTTGNNGVDPNRMPVIREVEINGRKDEVDLGTLWIYEES